MDQNLDFFNPVYGIHPLELPPNVIKELKLYGEAMDKLVALSTHLVEWERTSTTTTAGDEGAIVISFFKRGLEVVDGASLLIENACIIPAKGLARTLLETELQFEYFLSNPNQIADKVLHFSILEYAHRLQTLKKNRNDNRLKRYWPEIDLEIDRTNNEIIKPHFDAIRSDFEGRAFTAGGQLKFTLPNWFSLSGAGDTFKTLCEVLGGSRVGSGDFGTKRDHYDLYKDLSQTVHSTSVVSTSMNINRQGVSLINHMRDPFGAAEITRTILILLNEMISIMLKRRNHEQRGNFLYNHTKWHQQYGQLIKAMSL